MSSARPPAPISQADYESIEAAVMETERGRWFLAEYARRNRHADTERVLAAIARLQDQIAGAVAEPQPNPSPGAQPRPIDAQQGPARQISAGVLAHLDRLSAEERLRLFR